MATELTLTVQSLDDVKRTIVGYVTTQKRDHNPTIHGVYGNLRKQERYSFIGDYSLLHQCLVVLSEIGMPVTRKIIVSCVNRHCRDLKGNWQGKKAVMKELFIAAGTG